LKVAIHQPQYWPWPAYIHKVMSSDTFVYLDTVQYSKNGLQNRNQIKTQQKASWLTIPVTNRLGQTILETKIADKKAMGKHWKTLEASYRRTRGFHQWSDGLHSLFQTQTCSLCDLAIASTEWMLERLGVETKRVRASELSGVLGHGSKLVASICRSLEATTYLTGSGALAYMDREDFTAAGCDVWVQEWKSLEYEQAHPEIGFIPDLSALDLLMNCPDTAMRQIRSAGSWSPIWETG
jgi:hypothetical protein